MAQTLISNPNITDLKISDYKVVVIDAEHGTSQDLSQIVTSIQWDYDLDQPAERYTFSFINGGDLAPRVKPGDRIKLYGWAITPVASSVQIYWQIIKKIYIMSTSLSDQSGGELKAMGGNVMVYLQRNKDTIMLLNETATEFIKRTGAYFGIPLGDIADTGVVLKREPFINRTLWDMWVTALSYTRDLKPEARYILQENDGKVELAPRLEPGACWNFVRGIYNAQTQQSGNLFSASSNFSMENYVNVVRVYKGASSAGDSSLFGTTDDESTPSEDVDPTWVYQYPPQAEIDSNSVPEINRYGQFATSVDLQMPGEEALDLGSDAANAQQQAMKLYKKLNKIENTGTITSFNINTMKPADPVHITEPISGLVGKYYVKSGSHVVSDTESSMTLTVNIEDALPEAYEARRQVDKKDRALFGADPESDTPTPAATTGTGAGTEDPWTEVSLVTRGFTPGQAEAATGDGT